MNIKSIAREKVKRVLLVRLRSIGDTVLLTPCLTALKNWHSAIEIDVLTEPLSAPILQSHPAINHLWIMPKPQSQWARLYTRWEMIRALRDRYYDLAINLHGGTTATFLTKLAGAKLSVGFAASQYSWLLNIKAPNPQEIWQKAQIHCVEQQLALLKWIGIPLQTPPALTLTVEPNAVERIANLLLEHKISEPFAVIHPAAAFPSKQWETVRFAKTIEHLQQRHNLPVVIAVAPSESRIANELLQATNPSYLPIVVLNNLDLAELMALIYRATIFLGNDSGPAHIATAFGKPVVVIFGSSNEKVWHPWTSTPYRVVRVPMACAPCPGYHCSEFPEPECIKRVTVNEVINALDSLLPLNSRDQGKR